MYATIPQIKEVIHHENKIVRWWDDGKVEYCDLDSDYPIFKIVLMEPVESFTIANTDALQKEGDNAE